MTAGARTLELYVPSDVNAAHAAWGASCGQGALAALLGLEVEQLRAQLGAHAWASPTDITRALSALGRRWRRAGSTAAIGLPELALPEHGLAFVQFVGSWLNAGVPVGAAYARTHWVASVGGYVYDVNVGDGGGWMPAACWRDEVAPLLVASHRGATGWYVRVEIEVQP